MKIPLLAGVVGVAAVSHTAPTRVPNERHPVTEVTYDPFYDNPSESLIAIACSAGQSELDHEACMKHHAREELTKYITVFIPERRTLRDLPAFPRIGAFQGVTGWGSSLCGSCWRLTYNNLSTNVMAIDSACSGFVIAVQAMNELTGGSARTLVLGRVQAGYAQLPVEECVPKTSWSWCWGVIVYYNGMDQYPKTYSCRPGGHRNALYEYGHVSQAGR